MVKKKYVFLQKNIIMNFMSFIDFLDRLLASKKQQPPKPIRVINDPKGIVVAKLLYGNDLRRFMHNTDNRPGICPYCKNTLEKIPNLEFKTKTKKDFVCTYDGFYIVSEKFKKFCDDQGFKDLTFIPLKKSPGHYYFEPQTIFPVDEKNTIFEHSGEPCPKCGKYRWFGGPHRIYSKYFYTEHDNFICRLNELHGDKGRKFYIIIVGLKTEKLMKKLGLKKDYECVADIHFLNDMDSMGEKRQATILSHNDY
jgi:uncharacterized protein with PIN domain